MTPAERKALTFLAAVAVLGMGARAAGLGDPPTPNLPGGTVTDERAALGRQLAAVDSARVARRPRRGTAGARTTGRRARTAPDTAAAALAPLAPLPPALARFTPAPSTADTRARSRAPAARAALAPDPIDADQADSAALERLPGIGPALAHRIVADRRAHGPFGSMAGLSRVPGIGPRLEIRLAPLVTFSAH